LRYGKRPKPKEYAGRAAKWPHVAHHAGGYFLGNSSAARRNARAQRIDRKNRIPREQPPIFKAIGKLSSPEQFLAWRNKRNRAKTGERQ
jgi:hypothetical protein